MSHLDRLQARFGRYALPHLAWIIVLGQLITFIGAWSAGDHAGLFTERLALDLDKVAAGEVWRLFSFVIMPPISALGGSFGLFLFLLYVMFFPFFASQLERLWGTFRFNVFIAVGWLATLLCAVAARAALGPGIILGPLFLASIFLAFAWIWPNHRILLMLVIPVAVKWVALLTWLGYGLGLLSGDVGTRLAIVAGIANFAAFCGAEVWRWARRSGRAVGGAVTAVVNEGAAFHTCAACGTTEKKDPTARFRVCVECRPGRDYCMKCLDGHSHRIDTHV